MLHQLDAALKEMLRQRLGREQLEVAFDTPDSQWGAGLGTTPTLNLFLWDIRRSTDESRAGRERVTGPDGIEKWRALLPRIEFQYLLTAWTTEVADEHRLLGESLMAVLGCQVLDGAYRPAFVDPTDPPPTLRVVRADGKDLAEFWGAIDGKLKPGLNLVVTASITPRPFVGITAGQPVDEYQLSVRDVATPRADIGQAAPRHLVAGRSSAVGATVRSPRGATTVGASGTYLIDADAIEHVVVESPTGTVADPSGDAAVGAINQGEAGDTADEQRGPDDGRDIASN